MPSLPPAIVPLLSPFASLFDARTWRKVQILLTGVIPRSTHSVHGPVCAGPSGAG